MSREGLNALRARVHAQPELARRLRALAPQHFEPEVLRLAASLGADVTPADLAAARAQARQGWMLRWVR